MMILKAPHGTKVEIMQWLKGLRDEGCELAAEAALKHGLEVRTKMLDPRKPNVFHATSDETALQGTQEAREALTLE